MRFRALRVYTLQPQILWAICVFIIYEPLPLKKILKEEWYHPYHKKALFGLACMGL